MANKPTPRETDERLRQQQEKLDGIRKEAEKREKEMKKEQSPPKTMHPPDDVNRGGPHLPGLGSRKAYAAAVPPFRPLPARPGGEGVRRLARGGLRESPTPAGSPGR
jgi:hypothetical protein